MGALDWVPVQYVADGEADPDQFNAEVADNLNNAPRGIVARGQFAPTTSGDWQDISGTGTDLTNLTKTFTAVAGRLYKISLVAVFNGLSDDVHGVQVHIRKGASTRLIEGVLVGDYDWTGGTASITLFAVDEPGAGSVTYKGWAERAQTDMIQHVGKSEILVEDIGPV
jgi:hypothetical protein